MFTIPLPRIKSLLMHKNDILCTLYTGEVYVYSINSINKSRYNNNNNNGNNDSDILDNNNNISNNINTNNNIDNINKYTNNTIQPHTKLSLLDLPIRTSTIANNLILLGADNGRIYILSNEYKKVGELNVHTDIIRRVIYNNNVRDNSNNNMIGNTNTYNSNTNTNNTKNISVASCSDDTTIKLYSLENNHLSLISTLTGHNHYVMDISFINNNTLASCSIDTTIKIWNISTNTTISTLKGHIDCINSILYTNNRIYTAGDDHRINVYDYKKAKISSSYENISSYDIYKLYTTGMCNYDGKIDMSNNMSVDSNNTNRYNTTNIPNNTNINNIYIGTENSLMVYKDNKIYTLISNTTRVWDILIYNRYLFLATDEGIKIQKNKENRIIAIHKNKIYYNIDDTFITYKIKITDMGIDGSVGDRVIDSNKVIDSNNNITTTNHINNIINIMKREIDINNINITNIINIKISNNGRIILLILNNKSILLSSLGLRIIKEYEYNIIDFIDDNILIAYKDNKIYYININDDNNDIGDSSSICDINDNDKIIDIKVIRYNNSMSNNNNHTNHTSNNTNTKILLLFNNKIIFIRNNKIYNILYKNIDYKYNINKIIEYNNYLLLISNKDIIIVDDSSIDGNNDSSINGNDNTIYNNIDITYTNPSMNNINNKNNILLRIEGNIEDVIIYNNILLIKDNSILYYYILYYNHSDNIDGSNNEYDNNIDNDNNNTTTNHTINHVNIKYHKGILINNFNGIISGILDNRLFYIKDKEVLNINLLDNNISYEEYILSKCDDSIDGSIDDGNIDDNNNDIDDTNTNHTNTTNTHINNTHISIKKPYNTATAIKFLLSYKLYDIALSLSGNNTDRINIFLLKGDLDECYKIINNGVKNKGIIKKIVDEYNRRGMYDKSICLLDNIGEYSSSKILKYLIDNNDNDSKSEYVSESDRYDGSESGNGDNTTNNTTTNNTTNNHTNYISFIDEYKNKRYNNCIDILEGTGYENIFKKFY